MSQASDDIKATSSITLVDLLNLIGYFINILQYIVLIISNIKVDNGHFNY